MSFVSDLKKVESLDEAQLLFEKEVMRLSALDVYKNSEIRYNNRIDKVQNDIYNHLNKLGISGILYLYDDLLLKYNYSDDDDEVDDEVDDEILKRDKRFFKFLYLGICVWGIGLFFVSKLVNLDVYKTDDILVQKQSKLGDISVDANSDVNNEVWNEFGEFYTSQETLDEDNVWLSQSWE